MDIVNSFSTRLKQLREEHGLNQSQLADKLGISRGSISFYENGDRKPDIETLDKVVKYFDVPIDYLMGYINTKEKENIVIGEKLGFSDKFINQIIDTKQNFSDYIPILESIIIEILNTDIIENIDSLYNINFKIIEDEKNMKKEFIFNRFPFIFDNKSMEKAKLDSDKAQLMFDIIVKKQTKLNELAKETGQYVISEFEQQELLLFRLQQEFINIIKIVTLQDVYEYEYKKL